MIYFICFAFLFLIFFLIIQRIREKRQERKELVEFFEKGERLIAEFDQVASRNIDLLEEKIKEAKKMILELEEREKRIKDKRFPEVFRLKEEGFEAPQIAKMMKMGKAEVELILKQEL